MNKKTKVIIISSCIVMAYFISFLVLTFEGTCANCSKILWSLFLVPWLTYSFLGYDGQSGVVIWSVVLVEMILFFFLIKLTISLLVKEDSGS